MSPGSLSFILSNYYQTLKSQSFNLLYSIYYLLPKYNTKITYTLYHITSR